MKTLKILMVLAVCLMFGSNAFAASKSGYSAWQPKKQNVYSHDHNNYHKNKTTNRKKHKPAKKETVVKKYNHNNNAKANAAVAGTAAIILGIGILASSM